MKKWIIVILVLIVVAVAVILLRMDTDTTADVTRPVVESTNPQVRDIVINTNLVGTLEPLEEVTVIPMMSGEVLTVEFEVGDKVSEGDILATIKLDALKSLQIQLDSAKIQMDTASDALTRTKALYEVGAVSKQTLDTTQAQSDAAKLAYDAAKEQLDLQTEYSTITAPIDGVIETKGVDVHDIATSTIPICTISGDAGVVVTFGITSSVLDHIKTGDSVEVVDGANVYTASIYQVDTKPSQISGLYTVKATVDVETDSISNGTRAEVIVESDRASSALTIPLSAVYYSGGQAYVYTKDSEGVGSGETAVAGAFARKIDVVTGLYDDEYIEIVEGLTATDEVIYTWSSELYDGAEVVE